MKSFYCRVRSGTSEWTWGGGGVASTKILSSPSFAKEIDGGLGELTLELALPFAYDGADVVAGNIVETYSVRSGVVRLIHAGILEKVTETLTAHGPSFAVTVRPFVTQLARDYVRDDSNISKAWDTTDVSDILTDILDLSTLSAGNFGFVRHSGTSVNTSGTEVSIEVGSETYLSAIQRVKKLGPGNWYWHVDASGLFSYRSFDSGTKHTFTYGRDVVEVHRETDIGDIRNTVYFWNKSDADGSVVALERPDNSAAPTVSQDSYGRRVQIVTDSRIDDRTTAISVSDAYVHEHEDPVLTLEAKVRDGSDSGYDIETIEPGDTCEIWNVPALSSTTFSILHVDYSQYEVTLSLGFGPVRRRRTFGMSIEDMATFLRNETNGAIPPTYST